MRFESVRRVLPWAGIALVACAAAWFYSVLRAMSETVGLSAGGVLRPLGAILAAALVVGAIVAAATVLIRRSGHAARAVVGWTGGLLVASIVLCGAAEGAIQMDEHLFMAASERIFAADQGATMYSRDRWWPNGGTSLVAQRGQPPHATD